MVHSVYTKNPKLTRDRAVLEKIFFRLDFAEEIDYNITVLYGISRCVGMADEGDSKSLVLITRVGSTPTTGIASSSKSKGFGLLFFLTPASGSFSHVCLHRETADDVLEGVINAERKKGIGAFHGSKGYGRFRCFFVS